MHPVGRRPSASQTFPHTPSSHLQVRAPKSSPERREAQASAYKGDQSDYHRARPDYPAEIYTSLEPYQQGRIVDIGAGTGLFTQGLPPHASAIEPSPAMRSEFARLHPERTISDGSAESTGLEPGSISLATLAQTWHWCDVPTASAELDRILQPDGALAVVWNQLDTAAAWVKRFTRISRSGDIYRPGDRPPLEAPLTWIDHWEVTWTLPMLPTDLIALAQTRSFYLAADGTARERILANLDWYLHLHLGHGPEDLIEVPYLTAVWVAQRR